MLGRKTQFATLLVLAAGLVGCAETSSRRTLVGPRDPAAVSSEAWNLGSAKGSLIRSGSYAIHSTVKDDRFNQKLAQVMEGAMQQYRALAPTAKIDPRPLDCYVFGNRVQWAEFTRKNTGDDAAIYLQINRGGYTVRDFFVAYYIGDSGTYAVAAHEGWHQFVARHFQNRLPPFLEEGIATTFENISWSGDLPRWNADRNLARTQRLRMAVEANALWPLAELVAMHAGDVVGQPPDKIEAFYAQGWAFARFLLSADSRYRPAMQRMFADAVEGKLFDAAGRPLAMDGTFNPRAVRPMLEHYLAVDLDKLDAEYQAFIRKIAKEESSELHKPG